MKTAAIICEYNPFHLGHQKQFRLIRKQLGEETAIVCLMSGNYVQRGEPAIFSPGLRARAAVTAGANLVLELPITASLSSAEGFAQKGIEVLNSLGMIDYLSYGCETKQFQALECTARLLCSSEFDEKIKEGLHDGDSYASLRQRVLERMGGNGALLEAPNNILAVEYCKALFKTDSQIASMPIQRVGDYHSLQLDRLNPSACALREWIPSQEWLDYIPEEIRSIFENAPVHRLGYGEKAILSRLKAMEEWDYAGLPFGSEGLWRRLMHEAYAAATLDDLITAVKTKRYARSRIVRMILCAYLGIGQMEMDMQIPYVRLLSFDETGRQLLRTIKRTGKISLVHPGERTYGAYAQLEQRADRLYSLFSEAPCRTKEKAAVFLPRAGD